MKFKLTLVNDQDKIIRSYDLKTWYDDSALRDEITKDGTDRLEELSGVISGSLASELSEAVRGLLFV